MFYSHLEISTPKARVHISKAVDEIKKSKQHTEYQYYSFFQAALKIMKDAKFCGVVLTQTVYVPEFPEINMTRELRPSMLLQNDKILFRGVLDWAENEASRLEGIGSKLILANFNHPNSTN